MPAESEPVKVTWPSALHCSSEDEARAVHAANPEITTRKGRVVTFTRTIYLQFKGPKPQPPRRTSRPAHDPAFNDFRR